MEQKLLSPHFVDSKSSKMTPIKEGRGDVYLEKKENDQINLHWLINFVQIRGIESNVLDSILFSRQPLDSERRLFLNSLLLTLQLRTFFTDGPEGFEIPQWLRLAISGNSMRVVSRDFADLNEKLLSDIWPSREFTKNLSTCEIDSLTLLSLGAQFYSEDYINELLRSDQLTDLQKSRLSLHQEDTGVIAELIKPLSEADQTLLDIYAYIHRIDSPFGGEKIPVLMDLVKNKKFDSEDLLRIAHTVNSANYWHLNSKDFDKVLENIIWLETNIIPKTHDPSLSHHIAGILQNHRGVIADAQGRSEHALEHHLKSCELDTGFFEYPYRVAMAYHDLGDERALPYYRHAVSNSPYEFNIVNDYGCLLNDMDQAESLNSLTAIVSELNWNSEETD